MGNAINIEFASAENLPFLKRMLCAAAYWREDAKADVEVALATPGLSKLLANWGRTGDCALIASTDDKLIGAAWYRFWTEDNHSYGYLEANIPELAIGVETQYRGLGVGRSLLTQLISAASDAKIPQLSLSVEQDNPALALYESLGFRRVGKLDNSLIMVVTTLEQ